MCVAECDRNGNGDGAIFGPEEEACAAGDYPPATPDEVMDHIRAQCSGANLPSNEDKETFSDYFQASVRKTLNEERATFPYLHEKGSTNESSSHPQLTNKVDGYSEGFNHNGDYSPGVVTSIFEAKFGPPTNNIKYDQSRTHIDDLAKFYDAAPGAVELAPVYIIASNSQFGSESIGKFGPYTNRPELNLAAHAEKRGVNLAHLYVTRDSDGGFHLEGDYISTADFVRWANSWIRDKKMDFKVSCTPEK